MSKKIVMLVLAALLAIAVIPVLIIAQGNKGNSPRDFAVGSVKVTQASGDQQHIRFSAHSGPAGEDPQGHVHVTVDSTILGQADTKGKVTCLGVTGNMARITALLDQPFNGNTHVELLVFDNGQPVNGESPDTVFFGFTSMPPMMGCANFGATLLGEEHGNVVVHDATP